MINPLFWFLPGAPGVHIVSVLAVALLASWAFVRFSWRGLLVPALVICYSELQFTLIVVGIYHSPVNPDIAVQVVAPIIVFLYAFEFHRVPWLMLTAGYAVLLLDVFDGFKVSYGFPAGSPNVYDAYTNLKEIVAWGVVSLAAYGDARR